MPRDVRNAIRARLDAKSYVGLTIGLIAGDSTHVLSFGETSLGTGKEPDERTVYALGSVTEIFTGLLLADMVQRKEVRLEDTLGGSFAKGRIAPTYFGRPIRLDTLATHTSGLPPLPFNFGAKHPQNPFADYTSEELDAFLASHRLRRAPGAWYEQSMLGVALLGHALSTAAGSTYESLIVNRIGAELGLEDTCVTPLPGMAPRLALGTSTTGKTVNWDYGVFTPAAGLRSSVRDMLSVLAANLAIRRTGLAHAIALTQELRANDREVRLGFGWRIRGSERGDIFWKSGSGGGFSAVAAMNPTRKTGVVVLSSSKASVEDLALHVLDPKQDLRLAAAEAAIPSAFSVHPASTSKSTARNLIINGDYAKGAEHWSVAEWPAMKASQPRAQDGALCLVVPSERRLLLSWPAAGEARAPHFSLNGASRYRLSFRGSVRGPALDVKVKLGGQAAPYTSAFMGSAALSPELLYHEVEFQPQESIERAGLAFIIASTPGPGETRLCVDDVRLVAVPPSETGTAP